MPAITPYTRPQPRIFQNLRSTAANAVIRSGAMDIGVQYLLALNDGRELPDFTFSSAGAELLYRHYVDGVSTALSSVTHAVNLDLVELFGRDLEASVATVTALSRDGTETAKLRHTGNVAGTSLHSDFAGRAVRIGDLLAISADNVTSGSYVAADSLYYRKVTALLPKRVVSAVNGSAGAVDASAMSTNATANATVAVTTLVAPSNYSAISGETTIAGNASKFFEVGGRFNGKVGEEITFVCTTAGSNTTAVFAASYTTLGTSESVTSAAGAGATKYNLVIPAYNSSTIGLTITGGALLGDTIRLIVYPVHAANANTMVELVAGNAYTGVVDTSYIVEVIKGRDNATGTLTGAIVRVYDTAGVEPIQTYESGVVSFAGPLALGTRGLTFAIDTAETAYPDLVTGDKFIFAVTAPTVSTTEFDGVALDGPAFDPSVFSETGKLSIDIRELFNGRIDDLNAASGVPFTAATGGLTYAAGLGVVTARTSSPFRNFITGRGTLVVSYKAALKPGAVEGPIRVSSAAAIVSGQLGEFDIENDLAFGAYQTITANGGRPIYVLRTAADTVEAYTVALNKIRGTDIHYALAPLTDSIEVANLVALHCEEMSGPEIMNFRRCYFGTDSPGEYALWDLLAPSTYRRATLVGDLVTVTSGDRAVSNFITAPARVGDLINFLSLGAPLVITEVVSPYEVRVADAPSGGVAVASAFQLVKPDTADNAIDYVISRSRTVSNRRAVNVWCDQPAATIGGVVVPIPMKFVAAEIAGLRTALRPQQGLTMTEVASITEAPAMFARFTPEQLDRCASEGVMIVTQEIEGGEIFIRHQLTTETANGALQYEDSPGVVVDTFSFRVKDKFRSYLGKKNVTQATLAEIRTDLKQLANDATQASIAEDTEIGPLIVSFADEDGKEGEVTVRVDGDLADKILTFTLLRIALPLNGLTHYIDAEAAFTI